MASLRIQASLSTTCFMCDMTYSGILEPPMTIIHALGKARSCIFRHSTPALRTCVHSTAATTFFDSHSSQTVRICHGLRAIGDCAVSALSHLGLAVPSLCGSRALFGGGLLGGGGGNGVVAQIDCGAHVAGRVRSKNPFQVRSKSLNLKILESDPLGCSQMRKRNMSAWHAPFYRRSNTSMTIDL